MQCPRCGHENANSRPFCERCGSPQNAAEDSSEQLQYKAPPPPPLNGHKKILLAPPSQPSEDNHEASPAPLTPSISFTSPTSSTLSNPKSTAPRRIGIFSGVLYSIGIVITIFGLLGALTTLGSGTVIGVVGLLLTLLVLTISIGLFIHLRKRAPILRWRQRVMWLAGATLVVFLALILEVIVSPHSSLTLYYTAFVLLLYGLSWTAIAVW